MKLVYYQGNPPNFGDELNSFLWPKLLPSGFLDQDESRLFLGIGSIIWDSFPVTAQKFIIGSGYGGYSKLPNVHDGSWAPIFVRGPRTAQLLGLPPDIAICDSAILLRNVYPANKGARAGVGFMPHFDSLARGYWPEVCALAGVKFIDPTAPVQQTLADIAGLERLVTEAMHRAIVADALRTPWIAMRPTHREHHAKWLDWSEALATQIRWQEVFPSSALELYIKFTRGERYYKGRAEFWGLHPAAKPLNKGLTQLSALQLSKVAKAEPQLSPDQTIQSVTERATEALNGFVAAHSELLPRRVNEKGKSQKLARGVPTTI